MSKIGQEKIVTMKFELFAKVYGIQLGGNYEL